MTFLQFATSGLVLSAIYALLGQSIVVVHRGIGVPNFAAGAIGMFGAYVFYGVWPSHGIPWPLALAIAMAVSSAIGVAMHVAVMRNLRNASMAAKITATLALLALLIALVTQFFAPDGAVRFVPSFLPTGAFDISGNLTLGYGQIILVGIAAFVSTVLIVVQKRTRFGLATSAVCENEAVAAGMGWSPDVVAAANWAIGSAIATLAVVLLAPISGLSPNNLAFLVVPALAAALIGNFDSFGLAILGAIIIGIGESEVGIVTLAPGWSEAAPVLLIVMVLLVRGQKMRDRTEAGARFPSVGSGRFNRAAIGVAGVGLLFVIFNSGSWQDAMVTTMLGAIALLSIVVLTGYAGQLSLAQYGLAGVSAFLTALLAIRYGIPTVFAVLLAVAITVVVGLVVAIPALRTRGATLAVATVSLLVVIEDLLLTNPNAAQLLGQNSIKPMTIFGLNVSPLTDPRAYGVLVLIVFLALGLAVLNVRRSATGRRLLAIRANPNAAASLGISPAAVKMYAFALSSAIAAICGSLTEVRFSYPDFTLFNTDSSITQVLQGSIGGVGWISGALVGALAVSSGILDRIISVIASPSNWIDIVTAAGVFLVLLQSPDGIVPVSTVQLKRAYWHLRARIVPSQHVAGAMGPQAEDPFRQALREGYVAADRRSPALVEIECLSVEFGSVKALDGVSLTVAPGEIVGLIGPNGAGKSTLIDAVCGVLRPTSGEIRLDGESLIGLSPTGRARRGVIRSFQSLELFEDMTVSENLLVASQFPRWWHGITDLIWPARPRPTESARQAAQEFRLEPYFGSTPRMLDHGHRRLLAIARTFAADPAVVMLDEPAAGLDSRQRQELGVLLKKVAKEWNIGVLLVEHDVNLVFRMCDRVVALVNGCVVAQGSPDQVRENPQVVEAYLGTGVRRASPILGGRSDWTPSQLSKTGETALRSWVPT